MKNSILFLFCLTTFVSFAQEIKQLKLTPLGVEPMVIEIEGIKASDTYQKALNWVKETYKTPDKVLKAQIENKKIRIDGFARNAWWNKSMGLKNSYNMDYTIEISFKDGKYRFGFIIGEFSIDTGQKTAFGYSTFFKKSGEVRKAYKDAVPSLENTMNSLANSFYNYIAGNDDGDDGW